jgi:hypothetical protein
VPATEQTPYVIEGSFRVVATRDLPAARPFRSSPNRRRAAARIAFWNLAVTIAVVGLPIVLR